MQMCVSIPTITASRGSPTGNFSLISGVIMLNSVLSTSARTWEPERYGCSSETVSPRRARFWVVMYTGIRSGLHAWSIFWEVEILVGIGIEGNKWSARVIAADNTVGIKKLEGRA